MLDAGNSNPYLIYRRQSLCVSIASLKFIMSLHAFLENSESALKCLALVAAAGFFAYKLFTGWLIINLGVAIRSERVIRDAQSDHLALTIELEKGIKDSVWILDISVRLTPLEVEEPNYRESTTHKIYGYNPTGESENGHADWSRNVSRKEIALSPEEKAEYAGYAIVEKDCAYLVEVAVFGDNKLYKFYMGHFIQWKASAISIPIARVI